MNLAFRILPLFAVVILIPPASRTQTAIAGGAVGVTTSTVGPGGSVLVGGATCSMNMRPMTSVRVSGPTMPYSAVRESSSIQTLADGTHISPKPSSEKIFHDSQGRTRTERQFCRISDDPEAVLVEIVDPVAGYSYLLEQQNHIAHRYALTVREKPGRPTTTTTLKPVQLPSPEQLPKVGVVEMNAPGPNVPTTESLGTQTMEGVVVEGTRTTHVMATGQIGNDRPLTTVHEMWVSRELNLTMLMKTSDPRMGESTSRVTSLDTSEPSPLLFQPPPDYKIVDETESVRITYTRPYTAPMNAPEQ